MTKLSTYLGAGGAYPIGAVEHFPSNPDSTKWLACDGSIYNRSSYPALAAALGTPSIPNGRMYTSWTAGTAVPFTNAGELIMSWAVGPSGKVVVIGTWGTVWNTTDYGVTWNGPATIPGGYGGTASGGLTSAYLDGAPANVWYLNDRFVIMAANIYNWTPSAGTYSWAELWYSTTGGSWTAGFSQTGVVNPTGYCGGYISSYSSLNQWLSYNGAIYANGYWAVLTMPQAVSSISSSPGLLYSTNGTTWTHFTFPAGGTSYAYNKSAGSARWFIFYNSTRFFAIDTCNPTESIYYGSTPNALNSYYSPAVSLRTNGFNYYQNSIFQVGTRVYYNPGSANYNFWWYTDDGITWTQSTTITNAYYFKGAGYRWVPDVGNGGGYVLYNGNGMIYRSTDFQNWSFIGYTPPLNPSLRGIADVQWTNYTSYYGQTVQFDNSGTPVAYMLNNYTDRLYRNTAAEINTATQFQVPWVGNHPDAVVYNDPSILNYDGRYGAAVNSNMGGANSIISGSNYFNRAVGNTYFIRYA